MRTQGWQLTVAIGLGMGGAIGLPFMTLAQTAPSNIVEDATVGTTVIRNFFGSPIEAIRGGAERGQNLFHSFQEFNISPNRAALFLIPNSTIQNVFARVTGRNLSQIDGVLSTLLDGSFTTSTANLFLINPNGIIFGAGSSLNVGGSFVATTANAIQFGDRGFFSASTPNVPSSLLTINPSAFLFNQINAAPIQSNSRSLTVGDGQSLLLLGGDVTLDSSFLGVADRVGGRAELGGLAASGKVDLAIDSGLFRLSFPKDVLRGDVTIKNGSQVNVVSGDGGSIAINARNLDISRSLILAGIGSGLGTAKSQAGDIDLNVAGLTAISDSSICNCLDVGTLGNAGNLNIETGQLIVQGITQVAAATFGSGNAGNLTVHAFKSVELVGSPTGGQVGTGLFAQVASGAVGNGGSLTIETPQLMIRNGAQVDATTVGKGSAGNLIVKAADIKLIGTAIDNLYPSALQTRVEPGGQGNAGNLTIETQRLSVRDGAQIAADTNSKGNAGNLVVQARDSLDLEGTSAVGLPSVITTSVNPGAIGNGGNLRIETLRLSVRGGAQINATTFGQGNAGNLTVHATDVELIGTALGAVEYPSALQSRVEPGGQGNAGNLTIETQRLSVRDGARIAADTTSKGNAGSLVVKASDLLEVVGTSRSGLPSNLTTTVNSGAIGNGGNLTIETGILTIQDGARIASATFGQGAGGNIRLEADSLFLRNNGRITSRSEVNDKAGDVFIRVRDDFQANNGDILTSATQASGGTIDITARSIMLRGNSDIRSNVINGTGGNITLNANTIVALDDSDILAFAPQGKGGNITLNTRAFFGQNYRPAPPGTDPRSLDGNNRVDINASGAVSGIITLPDVSFLQNSLTEFPQTFTDTTQLLANSCIVRSRKQNGKFFITGSGGLPVRPGDAPLSPFPTGEVGSVRGEERGVRGGEGQGRQGEQRGGRDEGRGMRDEGREETYVIQNPPPGVQQVPDRPWKIGDPIVEPQGVYRLANGELVMSRECP